MPIPSNYVLRWTAWLWLTMLLGWPHHAGAEEPAGGREPVSAASNVFSAAVAYAQERCVKLYGAGIGREHGYATGIIVSADGKILCAQGIYLAGDRIRAVLPDGTMHLAEVVRRSDAIQTALVKIDLATPKYFDVPTTCPAKKGDWVLAVSNLFKVAEGTEELSVNMGVASLRTHLDAKRGFSEVHYDSELLLIDAITSNPGAPGGAVVTADGRLAGMIGRIIESTSTNTRLNYAVPSDLLRKVLDDRPMNDVPAVANVAAAKNAPGTLGIQLFTLGGKRAPAYIDRALPNSPAEKAGLKKDDLVMAVGAEIVHSVGDYQKAVADLRAGAELTLLIKRGSEIIRVTLVTAEVPDAKAAPKLDPKDAATDAKPNAKSLLPRKEPADAKTDAKKID